MRRRFSLAVLLAAGFVLPAFAQTARDPNAPNVAPQPPGGTASPAAGAVTAPDDARRIDLDVTRVALFSSGVGYFECNTSVTGDAQAELSFRTEQINDIIKSMVVQDAGGGRIGAIGYASRDPVEKALRSFGVDLTSKPTFGQLLMQLRGEPVEVAGAQSITGTIVGVEQVPIFDKDGKVLQQIERLTLHTSTGLQQIVLTEIRSLRILNEKVDEELRKALATLAQAHDADKKTVTINFEGTGQRQVQVAYLLEAPLWKTSYRLVLADDKKPTIQGWATVENATERDWNNVRLSLVSGRPISFRMDLYTPLYVPRPLEQLELYASLRPPEYEGGFAVERPAEVAEGDEMMGRRMAGLERTKAVPATPAAMAGGGGLSVYGTSNTAAEDMSLGLQLTERGVATVASAIEAGELFAYNIQAPVSIPRQHSAMLPIVNDAVEATKVSIYNPGTHAKYPLNGLELKNTTDLNLMQGPVTIFDDEIYAGDAKLPDLKPNEKRLVAYALDLATEVNLQSQPQPDELVSLRIARGTLIHRHKYTDQRVYEVKNKEDAVRTVLLEQPYSSDWTLVEPKEPYDRTPHLLRFKVEAKPSAVTKQTVKLERVADEVIALSESGLDRIQFFLRAKVISPKVKAALEKVIALRTERDDAARRRAQLEKQLAEASAEQARIRDNLRTLDKNADVYQQQIATFKEVENQIQQVQKDIKAARDEEEQKRKALEDFLLNLEIE